VVVHGVQLAEVKRVVSGGDSDGFVVGIFQIQIPAEIVILGLIADCSTHGIPSRCFYVVYH
jgi:hypothetical protein